VERFRNLQYPINSDIRDETLRIIDDKGENVGILTKAEALKKASEVELDLVLISPSANPPVARIIDYNKFLYIQNKKAAEQRKGHKTELKELQFKPNIDDFDLQVKINRAKEFLSDGDKVKFTVKFYGRMLNNKQIGYDKMNVIVQALAESGEVEKSTMMEGNFMVTYMKPK